MDAVIICRPCLPKFGAIAANTTFWQFIASSRHVQVPTKRLLSSPPCLLCRSPGPSPSASGLSRPKPHLSWVMKLTLAHTTALQPHTRPFQPQTPPARTPTSHMLKHNLTKAQPCSEWASATTLRPWKPLARHCTRLLCSGLGSLHDSTPTASFDARLVDLLWPQPPLTCSSRRRGGMPRLSFR